MVFCIDLGERRLRFFVSCLSCYANRRFTSSASRFVAGIPPHRTDANPYRFGGDERLSYSSRRSGLTLLCSGDRFCFSKGRLLGEKIGQMTGMPRRKDDPCDAICIQLQIWMADHNFVRIFGSPDFQQARNSFHRSLLPLLESISFGAPTNLNFSGISHAAHRLRSA